MTVPLSYRKCTWPGCNHIARARAHAQSSRRSRSEKHWMMLNSFVPICHVSLSWLPLASQHSTERSSLHFCHFYRSKHKSSKRVWKWAFFEFEASSSAFCCGSQVSFFVSFSHSFANFLIFLPSVLTTIYRLLQASGLGNLFMSGVTSLESSLLVILV